MFSFFFFFFLGGGGGGGQWEGGGGLCKFFFFLTKNPYLKRKWGRVPYLPYIFGRIKIIIFFTVRTFNLEKNYKFFSV